jgi:hypothetical protein
MGSSSKRQQTQAKRAREQALRERRAKKDEKRAARRAKALPEEGATNETIENVERADPS